METELESEQTTPYVRAHPLYDGVQAVDPIEETQFSLLTDKPADPMPCDTDEFYFPVDTAVTIEAAEIETPYFVTAWIRNQKDGTLITEASEGEDAIIPAGRHNIELGSPGVKIYLATTGRISIQSSDSGLRISVGGTEKVHIGVRSLHEQPAATVKTSEDPLDVMQALSTLGSALKTTSPERSFPTLRGHPPLIERGNSLDIPPTVEIPSTDVRIEVPPEINYLYPIASLTYYLGATVEPGVEPRLIVDGESISLRSDATFEQTVERILKQVFVLDCVTRTEGYYDIELEERRLVEKSVDLDFASLYRQTLAERVRRYLSVSFDDIASAIPKWKLTVDILPDPKYVSTLSFLAHELAVVRCPDREAIFSDPIDNLSDQIEEFFRNDPTAIARRTDIPRSGTDLEASETDEHVFRPENANSIEQAYVGDGIPYGASKMTVDSYRRRLDFEASSNPLISVAVVCNDPRMADENVVSEIYGTRDWIDFDIAFHEELTSEEMRSVLQSEWDFVHYIGHVDDEGIRCADGILDAEELDQVEVSAFLLNACNSYEQGRALVENGAMAGITTVTDVLDKGASAVGRTVARLLNQGFSLSSTIPLIKEHESIGHHYVVVGDGSLTLVENESGTPHSLEVSHLYEDVFGVSIIGYPSTTAAMGTLFKPFINDDNTRYLNSGKIGEFTVRTEELRTFLAKQNMPVVNNGDLRWSFDLEPESLLNS